LTALNHFARQRRLGAVGEVAARVEAHAEDGVAGLGQRQHDGAIGLRARMRLDVDEAAAEQLLGALDRQRLDRVRGPAALIIAPARIAFGIFVGEHGALRLQHRLGDDVLDAISSIWFCCRSSSAASASATARSVAASASEKKPSGWLSLAGRVLMRVPW
jgi:hypothetical protein